MVIEEKKIDGTIIKIHDDNITKDLEMQKDYIDRVIINLICSQKQESDKT